MDTGDKIDRSTNPRENANIFSLATFIYTRSLFTRGYKKDLDDDDLYEVIHSCQSKKCGDKLENTYRKKEQNTSTLKIIWDIYGLRYMSLGVLHLCWKLVNSAMEPQAISKLVAYFKPGQTQLTLYDALLYAGIMIGLKLLHCFYFQNYYIYLNQLAIQIRTSFSSVIYRKALRLSPKALVRISLGYPVFAIVGGHDTNITRHRFQASFQYNNEHFCGATLLFEDWNTLQWALTSAQCASLHKDNLSLRTGSSNKSTGGEIYEIGQVNIHPDYNPTTLENNIALIKTTENIWADYAAGAMLPTINTPILDPTVTITGWGKTNANGDYSELLQMVQLPVTTQDDCRASYNETAITDNMFCGGYIKVGDITACDGDYGGPGIIAATVYGVQSWGGGCGVAKYPTVFVKVLNYVDWIHDIIGIKL